MLNIHWQDLKLGQSVIVIVSPIWITRNIIPIGPVFNSRFIVHNWKSLYE
jgi:hypothetical protein